MFIKNLLKTKRSCDAQFEFDMFREEQNPKDDERVLEIGKAKSSYNFIAEDGTLKPGYGFSDLSMPENETDIDNETVIDIRGNEVMTMWKLKWYNYTSDKNCHYLFYYNDENYVCFDNLFQTRLATYVYPTEFSSLPFITNYRTDKQDAILLSAKDGNMMVIKGNGQTTTAEGTVAIISCCNHYGKLFAITANARGTLVYSDTVDVVSWTDELTKDLDFSDERGFLNKVISFNDYIYVFRDFGITKVSIYGNDDEFAVSHMYKSDGYIHPNTIVEFGDSIYFLEGTHLKVFNGTTVKEVSLKSLYLLKDCDNRWANAECFDGKYFLACRGDFDDGQVIGCECENYNNNMLLVYDIKTANVDILRGVDIRQLLALTNDFKSKLVACFYNENKARIGQLTKDGNVFENELNAVWKSGKTDFDMPGKRKKIKSFLIHSSADAEIVFTSEEGEKRYKVKGKNKVQKIACHCYGNMFEIKIVSNAKNEYISNFVITVSA